MDKVDKRKLPTHSPAPVIANVNATRVSTEFYVEIPKKAYGEKSVRMTMIANLLAKFVTCLLDNVGAMRPTDLFSTNSK